MIFKPACLAAAGLIALLPALAPADLAADLETHFAEAGLAEEARLAVVVTDTSTGEFLVEINPRVPMKPASTTKLFTAAAALETLGPHYTTRTRVMTDGAVDEDGTLQGNLFIRGGGDPGLGPRFQEDKDDVTKVMREWAERLEKQFGIRSISGDVVGDDRLFTGPRSGTAWYPDERAEWYMAEIGALTFNDGCVDLHFRAKGSPGKETKVELAPDIEYFEFVNRVLIGPEDGNSEISLFRNEDENRHVATGIMPRGTERTRWTAVHDPAKFTAAVLRSELEEEGVEVGGFALSTNARRYQDAPAPEELSMLFEQPSAPLSVLLEPILANSQNLYSEMVGRLIALETGREPDFDGAAAALLDYAERHDLVQNGFLLMDASGLSGISRVPARSLNDLLLHLARGEYDGLIVQSLARPDDRGSLRTRLGELEDRISAKTGSLGDTSTIAGYLTQPNGGRYAVTVMIDSTPGAQRVLDELVLMIDEGLKTE